MREYEVEICEEPFLFVGLVTILLGILRAFLVKLKAVQNNGTSDYFSLLDSVDKRVLQLGRFFS